MESWLERTAQSPSESAAAAPDDEMASVLELTAIVPADSPLELTAIAPADSPPVAAPAAVSPLPPAQAIRCEFCGTVSENPTGKFCDQCGRRLTRTMNEDRGDSTDAVRCLQCGHRNKPGTRICVECGNLMRFRPA